MTDVLKKLAEAIRREEAHDEDWVVKTVPPSLLAHDADVEPARKRASVELMRSRALGSSRRRGLALGVGLMLAAAVAAALLLSGLPGPVPIYVAELVGGEATMMGAPVAPGEPLVLSPESRISLTLRPEEEVKGAVAVRAFVVGAGGARALSAPFETSEDGTVRLTGRAADVFRDVPLGAWDILVFVGREESLPREAAEVEGVVERSNDKVRALRKAIVLEAQPASVPTPPESKGAPPAANIVPAATQAFPPKATTAPPRPRATPSGYASPY